MPSKATPSASTSCAPAWTPWLRAADPSEAVASGRARRPSHRPAGARGVGLAGARRGRGGDRGPAPRARACCSSSPSAWRSVTTASNSISLSDPQLAQGIAVAALVIILYEGGLSIRLPRGAPDRRPRRCRSPPSASFVTAGVVRGRRRDPARRRSHDGAARSARWSRRRTPPRCSRRCATSACLGGSATCWRWSREPTTPWRSCSRWGSWPRGKGTSRGGRLGRVRGAQPRGRRADRRSRSGGSGARAPDPVAPHHAPRSTRSSPLGVGRTRLRRRGGAGDVGLPRGVRGRHGRRRPGAVAPAGRAHLPRGLGVHGPDRAVPAAGSARVPQSSRRGGGGGASASRSSSSSSRARSPCSLSIGWMRFRLVGARARELGGPARRGADRAGHVPPHVRAIPTGSSSSTWCSSWWSVSCWSRA